MPDLQETIVTLSGPNRLPRAVARPGYASQMLIQAQSVRHVLRRAGGDLNGRRCGGEVRRCLVGDISRAGW